MKKFANLISYIFHPVFLPVVAFLFFFDICSRKLLFYLLSFKLVVILIMFMITILIPVLLFLFFLKKKYIHSLEMNDKEERVLPYIVSCVFYFVAFTLFQKLQLPSFFKLFLLGGSILTFILLIINHFWKISAHMTGMGSLLGTFLAIAVLYSIEIPLFIPSLILLSGVVGFARLQLNRHSPLQIYAGFILGFLGMFWFIFLLG